MKRRVSGVVATVVVLMAGLVACGGATHPSGTLVGTGTVGTTAPGAGGNTATSLPGVTPKKLARLKAIARALATTNGDAHPSSAMVFASRRHEANIAAGAGTGVFGNQPVYLLVLHGHFVCSGCSGPAGHKAPHGDVITTVLDRTTLQDLDFGVGGEVDTSKLSPGLQLQIGQS